MSWQYVKKENQKLHNSVATSTSWECIKWPHNHVRQQNDFLFHMASRSFSRDHKLEIHDG